jgi:DNA polymerase elongation subunit (family B)
MITGAISNQASKENLIIPTFKNDNLETDYIGGYVHDPERGLSVDVISYDANSLYPNTIITLNVSPETKIGKVISKENSEYVLKLTTGKTVSLKEEVFNKLLIKEQLSLSKHNILYSQKFKGVIPKFIDTLYSERVDAKDRMLELSKKLHTFKNKEEIQEQISDLDTIQYTYKILLNSIYGVFGQKYSPFYDVDHAASITLTGQSVVKQAAEIISKYAMNIGVECTKEDIYRYGDTDSIYISINKILKHKKIDLICDNQITDGAKKLINDIGQLLNTNIKDWAKEELKSTDPRFIFKQESTCDVAVFMEKKRYILHIIESEGLAPKNPFKYVGVEVVRSSFSEPTKKLIKDVIESAILSKDKQQSDKILKNAYEKFCKMPIEDISFRTKITDIKKQINKIRDGKIGLGTPVHAKGAIYFNQMLAHLNLEAKYESISNGIKIKWFYPSKNTFNYNAMSFIDDFPIEFTDLFKINFEKMFDKSVTPPVERLYDCLGWQLPQVTQETVTDLIDLFGN